MFTIILSCKHEVAQNKKPRVGDSMECQVCNQISQILDVQEHRRDSGYPRLVVAEFVQPAPISILDRLSKRP